MKKILVFAGLLAAFLAVGPADGKPKPCKKCYCSVTATDVAFGAYDGLAQLQVDSTGDVEVSCGTDTIGDVMSYEIELSGSNKGTKPREMKESGNNILEYNLYTDPSRTLIWGDGKGSTVMVTDSYTFTVLCCVTRNYTIYGRLFSGQNVEPGSFSDSITVKVDF